MKFRHVNTIMHKELQGYFNSPMAYIFITVFLVFSSWLFFSDFFLVGQATMRGYFSILPWIFLFLIPAITMRLWAEEQKMGTLEILLTAPVTLWETVLGKFFASFAFLVINLILSLILPAILFFIGNPDWGVIAGGYFGAMFLGAAYLAIGLWVSTMTDSQIVAFILSVVIIFVLYMVGEDTVLHTLPIAAVPALKYLGLGTHFTAILRGVLDSRDIVYYLLLIFIFLYLTVGSLNRRKWS